MRVTQLNGILGRFFERIAIKKSSFNEVIVTKDSTKRIWMTFC